MKIDFTSILIKTFLIAALALFTLIGAIRDFSEWLK